MRGLLVTAVSVGSSRPISRLILFDPCTILTHQLRGASSAPPVVGWPMITRSKLRAFLHCALTLGQTPREQFKILWALSKNIRARAYRAPYNPERVYKLGTVIGDIYLRDNFGDVTNLYPLFVENAYRVTCLAYPGEILDVGANIGLFARWVHTYNPERRLHCFEPLPSNAAMVHKNCPAAIVNQIGLGRGAGTVTLGVDQQGVMASSIAQPWSLEPIEIQIMKLDTYADEQGIGEVAFLKVDTEGMEVEVLEGAPCVLARTHQIALETHGEARHQTSLDRLRGAGFRIEAEERKGRTGMIWASHHEGDIFEGCAAHNFDAKVWEGEQEGVV